MRIGIGYDIHALAKGRKLLLGGVSIPHSHGLLGHSDGDVLLHAIVDAVFGALGEGDLGDHFSDKDPRWKGADSRMFVKEALLCLKKRKLAVAHIDSVIIAEAPKLGKYKEAIKKSVASAFGLPLSSVGVKAKTNEGFDAIGRGEAIACQAVVSLKKGK